MSAGQPLYLVVSLDVEEEGLFGGRYARRACSVRNTESLRRLEPLCRLGVRPTLFCAHSVLTDAPSRETLVRLRDRHQAEIGAHLHHWNTPPLTVDGTDDSLPDTADRVPAAAVPETLLAAKLARLTEAARALGAAPTSFRMGRWDMHRNHWPLLTDAGFLCDASVRPLHSAASPLAGPDHFDAPTSPYWVPVRDKKIFEVPLTVTPLVSALPRFLRSLPAPLGASARAGLKNWGALALLPVYHPLWAMRAVTSLYAARGGRVLSLTWHSSEMMPGGAPHMPDSAAVQGLMDKIAEWLAWLRGRYLVRCVTMDELRRELGPASPTPQGAGDWTCAPTPSKEPGALQGSPA